MAKKRKKKAKKPITNGGIGSKDRKRKLKNQVQMVDLAGKAVKPMVGSKKAIGSAREIPAQVIKKPKN